MGHVGKLLMFQAAKESLHYSIDITVTATATAHRAHIFAYREDFLFARGPEPRGVVARARELISLDTAPSS
jgi:hypothetical protein